MKKTHIILCLFILVLFSSLATAESCVYYFYGEDCPTCPAVSAYLRVLEKNTPDLTVQRFEVYYDKQNAEMLKEYFKVNDVPASSQGLPAVFMPNGYFIGQRSIQTLLSERLKDNDNPFCPTLEKGAVIGLAGDKSPQTVLDTLTFSVVGSAALSSSVSAGMIALLILLLLLIVSIKDRETMLVKGLLFILVIILTYGIFAFGKLGWFAAYGEFFPKMIGILAIILGIGLMKSFFGTWKVILRNIPQKPVMLTKELLKFYSHTVFIIILAIITAVWTFFGADRQFLIMRILFADYMTRWSVFPTLVYYLVLLVLPLILVVLAAYFIRKRVETNIDHKYRDLPKEIEKWKKHILTLFNFGVSIIILVLGIIVLML